MLIVFSIKKNPTFSLFAAVPILVNYCYGVLTKTVYSIHIGQMVSGNLQNIPRYIHVQVNL